jgi:hypothetical protein
MYAVMLASGNTDFVSGINRPFPAHRTSRLSEVVKSLEETQRALNHANLLRLLQALHAWSRDEPNEFANRGGTNGIAYRLWMEAKQMLLNRFKGLLSNPAPTMPSSCPGNVVLGVYIPPGEGGGEICHRFSYRWAIAAGKTQETVPPVSLDFTNSEETLFPLGVELYPDARTNGQMNVQAGDIIGMFSRQNGHVALQHSLVAVTNTIWFGANNTGTFGVGLGRTEVDITNLSALALQAGAGWVGNDNVWKCAGTGMLVHVVFRRL